jgi:hypothetical protein
MTIDQSSWETTKSNDVKKKQKWFEPKNEICWLWWKDVDEKKKRMETIRRRTSQFDREELRGSDRR